MSICPISEKIPTPIDRFLESNDVQIYDRHRYACFTYHFGASICVQDWKIIPSGSLISLHIQVVGMKFVLVSPTINGLTESVSAVSDFFRFE